ncbi:PREDICTED: uncharacterized protein LOC104589919 [Nelumbo nucifera]|uniref:Transcriptional coactivator Hfi1/Transcriptional adapter 1 n=2 Tax=Nelumbo nucifera TaxID=4432 RepID=A0A822ZV55_NELNU|nr:PREDICTED: uncharacterized protein LOC104589919 [Nelumbo nucifera]DAD45778.1 TPA_asm: hypothetical protein HUJ06_004008 [Nelumbo nucifera]
MQPSQQHSRINLADLKAQIVKKLGPERSRRYFYNLNGLLSQKLSKIEFDKLCYRILGRENLPLHNQLIRSILKNACIAKVPPPVHGKEVQKSRRATGKKPPSREDLHEQGGPSPIPTQPSTPTPKIWANGGVVPTSPPKIRSGIHDRKLKDLRSPLGPNGKIDFASQQLINADDNSNKVITENGDFNLCDLWRPVQNHQGLAEQPQNELEVSLQHPPKRSRINRSPDDLVSVHSKGQSQIDVVVVEDGEEVEQANNSNSTRSPLQAPLGIPFCSASVGGAHRAMPVPSSSFPTFDSGELFDTEILRKHMEQIAGAQGLEGVSTDCANLLNNGLDAYLKRLIKSCIELVGARSGYEPTVHPVQKQHHHGKLINGVLRGHNPQMQYSSGSIEGMQEQRTRFPISLLDFKVAMELNPQQLGEDWPLLMEKICMHTYEE